MARTRAIVEDADPVTDVTSPADRAEWRADRAATSQAGYAAHGAVYGGPPAPPTGAGAVVDLLFLPVHAATAIFSAAAQEIGRAAKWTDAVEAGKAAVMVDAELSRAVGEKPLAALQVAGGAVLAATGIATSVGVGLIGNGARELAGAVFHNLGVPDVQGGGVPAAPGGELASPTHSETAPDAPYRPGLFARFAAWLSGLFHGGRTQ